METDMHKKFEFKQKSLFKFYKKRLFGKVELVLIVLVAVYMLLNSTLLLSKNNLVTTPSKIEIQEGQSAANIADDLYLMGIIDNPDSFVISAKMLNLSSKLKAGTYFLSPSMSNYSIITNLALGRAVSGAVRLVVPEGSSIYKIARAIEKNNIRLTGNFDALETKGITSSLEAQYSFLRDLPIKSLEGYLFPDTYMVNEVTDVDSITNMMLTRFQQVVIPIWKSVRINKFSLHELITLASIVEKEAETDSERPIIASVFFNRLKSGMPLRADPTVKYALPSPHKRLFYSDLKYDSPYNTYLNKGLPPGPICNPGLKSILAVMYPARTNFIYFVSNGDGTHTFSENWAGHVKAVGEYRKIQDQK